MLFVIVNALLLCKVMLFVVASAHLWCKVMFFVIANAHLLCKVMLFLVARAHLWCKGSNVNNLPVGIYNGQDIEIIFIWKGYS